MKNEKTLNKYLKENEKQLKENFFNDLKEILEILNNEIIKDYLYIENNKKYIDNETLNKFLDYENNYFYSIIENYLNENNIFIKD